MKGTGTECGNPHARTCEEKGAATLLSARHDDTPRTQHFPEGMEFAKLTQGEVNKFLRMGY